MHGRSMVPGLDLVVATALVLASCEQPPPVITPQPPPQQPTSGPPAKPPMPAVRPGMVVSDRTGARIGTIQAVTETPGGLNVVIAIEGKLVGVSPSALSLRGEAAVSSQTKEEILANAGAPR